METELITSSTIALNEHGNFLMELASVLKGNVVGYFS